MWFRAFGGLLGGVGDPLLGGGFVPVPVATVDGNPRTERLGKIVSRGAGPH
jgi:hypothetical protein